MLKLARGLFELTGAKRWLLLLSLALPLAVLSGLLVATQACDPVRPRTTSNRTVVALEQIGGGGGAQAKDTITETDLRAELARIRFEREGSLHAAPLPSALKEALIQRMIDRRILLLEAEQLGVRPSTTAVAQELTKMRETMGEAQLRRTLLETYQTERDLERTVTERLTVGKLMTEVAHSGVSVTGAELEEAWNALPAEQRERPARVRASQIVVRTEEEGKSVLAELKRGTSFEALARAHSIGPEGARGGDLGWIEAGVMPKIIEEVCFALKPDQISPLTPSEYGFHLFKVTGSEAATARSFEDAKPTLEAKLLQQKLERAEAELVAKLRSKYRVVREEPLIAAIE